MGEENPISALGRRQTLCIDLLARSKILASIYFDAINFLSSNKLSVYLTPNPVVSVGI